jgi:diguanylate cyclase (GGDEF)-like protein
VEALAPFADDAHSVTVSIGIGLSGPQHDLSSVLRAADEALYRAKAKGRNRVEGPDA